jgi:hypothetical protein
MAEGKAVFTAATLEDKRNLPGKDHLGPRDGQQEAQAPITVIDRDRGTPRGATPPTPPGIRVTYHGGSTGLGLYSRAFGCWLRHDWFGPLVTADPGFTLVRRFQSQ